MDAFACQGVNMSCSIANNDKVVIEGCSQSLTPKAQTCSLHTLYLGVGAQRLADKRIILDCALMQSLEIALLYSSELKSKTASQVRSWTNPLPINLAHGCHHVIYGKPCRDSATSPTSPCKDTRCCSCTPLFCRQISHEVTLHRLPDSVR